MDDVIRVTNVDSTWGTDILFIILAKRWRMAAYDPLAQIAGIFFISNNFSNVFTFRCPHFGEYNMETLVVHYPINNSLYSTNSAATYQYCCVCHKTFCQNLFVFVLHFIKKNFDISSIIKDNNNFGGAGMTKRHSSKEEQQNYTKLDNDYVRNTDKAINRKAQSRKRKLRRIVFFLRLRQSSLLLFS